MACVYPALQKLNTTQKKQTQNTAKQNYSGSVVSYATRPENEVGLFYNTPKAIRGASSKKFDHITPVLWPRVG